MEDIVFGELKKLLPGAEKNVLLKNCTTFKIGGPARYFFIAKEKEDLIKSLKAAKKLDLPLFVLAGGSNVLASDRGFKGLVIRMQMAKFQTCLPAGRCQKDEIFAEAGVELSDLVRVCEKNNLTGLEWAAGIPGTVGGAVFGNAQAFGSKISDLVENVEVLDIDSLKIKKISSKACKFKTKNSIFKTLPLSSRSYGQTYGQSHKKRKLIILSVCLNLENDDKERIQEKIKEFLDYRKVKHPNLLSAGSVFVNPEKKITNKKLLEKFPELSEFNKKGAIPAAYLIEKAGLKGKKIGQAQISEKHANFIVNLGGAKAKDVLRLIELAQDKVEKVFRIKLKPEVQFIGLENDGKLK